MTKLVDIARMTTATTGTGPITLGVAVSSFLSFSAAGVADQDTITYAIEDGANREIGHGVYTASGTTLTRNVLKSTNGDTQISLSGNAQVFITLAAEDYAAVAGGALASLATPTLRQSAFTRNGGTSISATFGSAPAAGNLLVAMLSGAYVAAAGWTLPAGWTSQIVTNPTSQTVQIATKIADGTEGTTVTFTGSSGSTNNLAIMEWVDARSIICSSGTACVDGTFVYAGPAIWPPPFQSYSPTIALSMISNISADPSTATPASAVIGTTILEDFGAIDHGNNAALLLQSAVFSNALDLVSTPGVLWGFYPSATNYVTALIVGGVHSTNLSTSTDVDLSTPPTDGQALAWKSSTNKWTPKSFATALTGLSDVNVTEGSGIDSYVLTWNNTTSKWIAAASSGGGGGSAATYTHYRMAMLPNGQASFGLAELTLKDHTNTTQTASSCTSNSDYSGVSAATLITGSPGLYSASSTETNVYIDLVYATAFAVAEVDMMARTDSYYAQAPMLAMLFGSNDGTTFTHVGNLFFGIATSSSQVMVAKLP